MNKYEVLGHSANDNTQLGLWNGSGEEFKIGVDADGTAVTTDILTYDLAIAVNAWCFDKKNNFKDKKFQSLLIGYNYKNKLL